MRLKILADVSAVTAGATSQVAAFMDMLQPAIAACIGIASLIWIIYRINNARLDGKLKKLEIKDRMEKAI